MIEIGAAGTISYTDDTSLRQNVSGAYRVSISADVIVGLPMEWFYELLKLYPDVLGELKSGKVNEGYFLLDERRRRKIDASLRHVRINIVDPRAHATKIRKALQDILPNTSPEEFLKRLHARDPLLAQNWRRMEETEVVRRMMWDSPPARLRMRLDIHKRSSLLFHSGPMIPSFNDSDFDPFRDPKKQIRVAKASQYMAKAGAVFHAAVEDLERNPWQVMSPIGPFGVQKALASRYAFDEGNQRSVDWIDEQRRRELERNDRFYPFRWFSEPEPLDIFDSKISLHGQASDLAGGIASAILERRGIVEVFRIFDVVYYNGSRLTEEKAEDVDRRFPVLIARS